MARPRKTPKTPALLPAERLPTHEIAAVPALAADAAEDAARDTSGIPPDVLARFRVHPTRLSRPNVAIVGFTDHRKLALSLDDTWELWGLNELHRYEDVKRFHRWFEIHNRVDLEKGDAEHLKQIAAFDIPIYMWQHYEDIPCSLPFPKAIVERVAGEYMTSSPAWMMGLAITLGAKQIALYGIDLAQQTEYFEQRPCVEYLIGLARGLGIPVTIPNVSDLMKVVGQYGFDEMGSGFRTKLKDRLAWLHRQDNDWLAQLRSLEAQFESAKANMATEYTSKREQILCNRFQVAGAISDVEYILRSFTVPGDGVPGEPTPDRSKDPRTGITSLPAAAAGDSLAKVPAFESGQVQLTAPADGAAHQMMEAA